MSSLAIAAPVEHPCRSRSRLSNRPFALPGVNGNTAEARHFRDLCVEFATELTSDPTTLSETNLTLVRATACLAVEAARLQACVVKGEAVDHEQLVRVNNALTRNLGTLRKKAKQPHAAGPNLTDYLASRGMRQA
jgi:hypothetical protein